MFTVAVQGCWQVAVATPATPTLALARLSDTSFRATITGADAGATVYLYYRTEFASAWSSTSRASNGVIDVTGVSASSFVYAVAFAYASGVYSLPSSLVSVWLSVSSDEPWTLLSRLRTVAKSIAFRTVVVESGDQRDISVSNFPACVVRLVDLDEDRQASDTGVQHVTNVDLHVLTGGKSKDARLEQAVTMINSLKNAIAADAVVKQYLPMFSEVEFVSEDGPVEHGVVTMMATHWTTNTGR